MFKKSSLCLERSNYLKNQGSPDALQHFIEYNNIMGFTLWPTVEMINLNNVTRGNKIAPHNPNWNMIRRKNLMDLFSNFFLFIFSKWLLICFNKRDRCRRSAIIVKLCLVCSVIFFSATKWPENTFRQNTFMHT